MRVQQVTIDNFRGVSNCTIQLDGSDATLIGVNGGGKTAVLAALAKALGVDWSMGLRDFSDTQAPVEVSCVLSDLPTPAQNEFADQLTFGATTTLTIGVRAIAEGDEVEVVHGFPNATWRRATRAQCATLPVLWLPAWRDPVKLLGMVGSRSVLARLLRGLPIQQQLLVASQAVSAACAGLAAGPDIANLLRQTEVRLTSLVSGIPAGSLSLGQGSERDLLQVFEAMLAVGGVPAEIHQQSSGFAQLCVFAFALQLLATQPDSLTLVDEPEVALHPQPQRALVSAIRAASAQSIVATHSAAVLDRIDPRTVIRLERQGASTVLYRPAIGDEREARRLMRHSDPRVAEAFFATAVLLVEGPSDRLALLALAAKQGRNLDAAGVSILALDGAGLFATMVGLLGQRGLGIRVAGMCDADKEVEWGRALAAPGGVGLDRAQLRAMNVIVLDPDLEILLLDALGLPAAEAIIVAEGESGRLATFRQQPANRTSDPRDVMVRFLKKDKTRWAPLLVEALDVASVPSALMEALNLV